MLQRSASLDRMFQALGVRTCHIESAALDTAERWINERRGGMARRLDRLGEYLAGRREGPEATEQR